MLEIGKWLYGFSFGGIIACFCVVALAFICLKFKLYTKGFFNEEFFITSGRIATWLFLAYILLFIIGITIMGLGVILS